MSKPKILTDMIDLRNSGFDNLSSQYIATEDNITHIPIGLNLSSLEVKSLKAYLNGVKLIEDLEYSVTMDNTHIDLLGFAIKTGDSISFEVWRKVIGSIDLKNSFGEISDKLNSLNSQLADIAYMPTGLKKHEVTPLFDNNIVFANMFINHKRVYIPDGTYYTSQTVNIPNNCELILAESATIKPLIDIDVILLNSKAKLVGGIIDVSGIAFTKTAIAFNCIGGCNSPKVEKTHIINTNRTGYGIKILPDGNSNFCVYPRFTDVVVERFKYGVYVDFANLGWVTGLYFTGTLDANEQNLHHAGDGSYFNIRGNAGYAPSGTPSIYISRSYNHIDSMIFDVGNPGLNDIMVKFDYFARYNVFNNPYDAKLSKKIIDFGMSNSINGFNQTIKPAHYPRKAGKNDTYDYIMSGNQDNSLAYADKKYTVTFTGNNASADVNRPLANAFNPEGESFYWLFFSQADGSGTISITNAGNPINVFSCLGVTFSGSDTIAKHTKIRFNDGGIWYEKEFLLQESSQAANIVTWDLTEFENFERDNITEIQFIFMDPGSSGWVWITSIFGCNGSIGNTFLPKGGGDIYGDINITNTGKGVILKSPNGTKYRLKVADNGTLSTEVVTQ